MKRGGSDYPFAVFTRPDSIPRAETRRDPAGRTLWESFPKGMTRAKVWYYGLHLAPLRRGLFFARAGRGCYTAALCVLTSPASAPCLGGAFVCFSPRPRVLDFERST